MDSQSFNFQKNLIKITSEDLFDKQKLTLVDEQIYQSFKTQKMVIIKSVESLRSIRKKLFDTIKTFPERDIKQSALFSIGPKSYGELINFYSNYYSENYLQEAEKLGITKNHTPDLLSENDFSFCPDIENSIKELILTEKEILIKILESLDRTLKEKHQIEVNLAEIGKNSESTKTRSIYILPQKEKTEGIKTTIYGHFDNGLLSCHLKDKYLKCSSVSKDVDEVENPGNAGLYYKNANGEEYLLKIEEDELMFQGGIALQILTGREIMAQGHSVLGPIEPNISRISHITYFQPKLSTKLSPPNQYNKINVLEVNSEDLKFVNERVFFSNHYRPDVMWFEAHHNQIMQFLFYGLTKNLTDINPKFFCKMLKIDDCIINHVNFDILDSTQTLAKKVYSDYTDGNNFFALTAKQQTAGRGQHNNKWNSPPGNLYVTYIFSLPAILAKYSVYISTVSVLFSIREMFSNFFDETKLKWINDIFMKNKKVSGSLIETETMGGISKIFMGIGVNLNSGKDDFINLPEGSSIGLQTGLNNIDVEAFFNVLTENLVKNIKKIQIEGFQPFYEYVKFKLEFLKEEVLILDPVNGQEIASGIFETLNFDGSVTIKDEYGIMKEYHYGRMRKK
jgi:BirA family biotin operon repressor/biotin-[acetyl-CoA-carboxylase] ligase